ncbi:TatD family hydrolase [Ruminococcaceae bacterium OttesenSCG-928-A16]|nr:TatD family hydrolase [Ruminococcaceae bacterium OttesenSCG-928-A16]
MQRLIFDTHAHYTSGAFDENREELLQSLPAAGVALVVDCGTDLTTSQQSLALAGQYPWFYTAVGIHPQSLIEEDASTLVQFKGDWRAELREIETLYQNPRVVAVGECGLDHHWPVPKEAQLALFEAEIRTALEHDLPLIVHDREAHAETYALIKKYKPKGVLHSYSGSAEDVKWLVAQGMYLGFTGVVTFKNARRPLQAAAAVPAEYLLLETDCPYMAPEPLRGRKSNSGMIVHTAAKIAEARGLQTQDLLRQTLENGKRLFGIE